MTDDLTIPELESLLEGYEPANVTGFVPVRAIRQLIATMRERDRLRSALEWYADRGNYDWEGRVLSNPTAPRNVPPLCDEGRMARNALDDSTSRR